MCNTSEPKCGGRRPRGNYPRMGKPQPSGWVNAQMFSLTLYICTRKISGKYREKATCRRKLARDRPTPATKFNRAREV